MTIAQREPPDATLSRHATTLSELKKMHEDFAAMQAQAASDARVIDRQQNRIDVLEQEVEHWRRDCSIYRRKLIRLAAAMDMIGKLSHEAEEIMRSAREFEEAQKEAEEAEPVAGALITAG